MAGRSITGKHRPELIMLRNDQLLASDFVKIFVGTAQIFEGEKCLLPGYAILYFQSSAHCYTVVYSVHFIVSPYHTIEAFWKSTFD